MVDEKIEALEIKVSSSVSLKEKVDALNQLAFEIRNTDTQRAIELSKEAFQISSQLNYLDGKATALANEAFCYVQITNYELALEKLFEALSIFEEIKNEKGIAQVHYNLCLVYFRFSDFSSGLDSSIKALTYYKKVNDKAEMARCYFQMGFLYHSLNDFPSAFDYFNQGIELSRETGNKAAEAALIMGIGQAQLTLKEYQKSKENLFKSMAIREEIKDWRGYAAALNAYMTLCLETEKFDEAEKISIKGIKLATELGDKMGISRFMLDLGKIYFKQNKIAEAEKTIREALTLAEKINLRMALVPAYLSLSEIYQLKGDFENALKYYQQFHDAKEKIQNTNAAMKAKSIQLVAKIENAQQEAEINRLKNVEIKNAFIQIEEKQKEIIDSINYAKRIQYTLLASDELLKSNLSEHFILFKPKDIVSGDFYWAVKKENRFYLAVCDSTGHGVPGAFMSVLNSSFLNEAINEKNIIEPNEILNYVRSRLITSISTEGGQDGMDCTLICFEKNAIRYSSANNKPILICNGELNELNADKMPVGKGTKQDSFNLFQIQATKNTNGILYLFTDGYADQFGGESGQKKLTRKKFKELLLLIQNKTIQEQGKALDEFIKEYRKELDQIDDILVMGIRV